MKNRNLIFPLIVSSLFIPSIEPLESSPNFNSLDNENNIYEAVDILIAEAGGSGGGGGGLNPAEQKERDKKRKKAQEAAKKRNEAKAKAKAKAKEKGVKIDIGVNNIEKKSIKAILKAISNNNTKLGSDVVNKIQDIPELLIENETAPYILEPFSRCGILTEKALEAEENGNLKKANIYAELAIKSVIREKNILDKQGRQIKEKSIDPKLLENIEYSLLGINSIILDDYKSGNRYLKKASESENQDNSNLKTLIAYTEIINGEIDQGCADLEELIIDGTIDSDDLDIIPIEDICRSFPEE